MNSGDALRDLEEFIDERWAVVKRSCDRFRNAREGWRLTPHDKVPPLAEALTPDEAAAFLASIAPDGSQPPLFAIQDNNVIHSDRTPSRAYVFFENSGPFAAGLRLETIVHCAALARLRDEFGWPREHLICESPDIIEGGKNLLTHDALDCLLLEEPALEVPKKMSLASARSRVAMEAKATAKMLEELVQEMQACPTGSIRADHSQHSKCRALEVLRPRLFLSVAAGETWHLFNVRDVDGRAVLGDEVSNFDDLYFVGGRA
jgi:hypothetical protein